jgi:hypothetical protein
VNVDLNDPIVVLELLTTAVDEQGSDYVYYSDHDDSRGCEYFVDGKSACIVGRVFDYADVNFDFSSEINTKYGTSRANDSEIFSLAPYVGITNPEVVEILRAAQNAQDTGETWGDALLAAFGNEDDKDA